MGADPSLDVARLMAVRKEVGDNIRIRIDANQAWSPKQAVKLLNQMQDRGLDIEFVEQPVKAHDFEGLLYVTQRSYVPVLADESVFSPEDALKIMQMGAADMVNIKLMKCGGLYNALKTASAAEVYGVECMIGCMLEARISVNAAVHLACAKQTSPRSTWTAPCCAARTPSWAARCSTSGRSPSPTTQVWASMAFKGFAIWQTDTISVLSAFYKVRPIDSTSIVK